MGTTLKTSAVLLLAVLAGIGGVRASSADDPPPGPGAGLLTTPPAGFTLFSPPPEVRQELRGADRRKPESARRLIRGQVLDYGVWVDRADWKPAWSPSKDGDLTFVPTGGGDWGAYTVAITGAVPFQTMADLFVTSIADRGGRPRVNLREIRRINDNDFLCVELAAVWNAIDVRMIGCFFSNDREAISFVGYEPQSVVDQEKRALDNLMDGIVLVPPPEAGVRQSQLSFDRADGAPTSEPRRVDPVAGVDAPILKTRVEPVYPEEARLARESGVVILEGIISPEGCVENLMLLKPTREPLLDAAAIRAVQQWEYAPALFEGRGVSVYLTITVNFQLH